MTTLEKYEKQQIQEVTFRVPSVQEIESLKTMCSVLAHAPFYQKLGPAGVFAIYVTAKEMNLPFMACLNGGMYVVDGKVTLSAQLMNFLIVSKGHKVDLLEVSEKACRLRFIRTDGRSYEHSFTLEDAQTAGLLGKDNWKKYPKDMLFNRCLATGARKFLPDAILNTYIQGEIEEPFAKEIQNPSPQVQISFDPEVEKIPLLSSEQVAEIKTLLAGKEEVEREIMGRLHKAFGVESLEEVGAIQYENIIKAIKVKIGGSNG